MRSANDPDPCSPVRHSERTACGKMCLHGRPPDRKHVCCQERTAPERPDATNDTRRAAFKHLRDRKAPAYCECGSTSGATHTESQAASRRNDKGTRRICRISIHGDVEMRAGD